MTEHLTQQEIESFRRQTIDEADRRRMDAHLAGCEACLQSVAPPQFAFAALTEAFLPSIDEPPFHLSHADLKKLMRSSVDDADKIICESHLEVCAECNGKAQDLASTELLPTTIQRGQNVSDRSFITPFRHRLKWIWPSSGSLTPAALTAIVALVACFLIIALLWQRQRSASVTQQTDQNASPETQGPTNPNPGGKKNGIESTELSNQIPTPETQLALSLKDSGKEIGLDKQGNLVGLEGLNPSVRQAVAGVLAERNLQKPRELEELTAPPITLMEGSRQSVESFKLINPLGIVTTENRPTLRWEPLPGAEGYTVSVFDAQFNRIAASAPQTGTAWTVTTALPRGVVYSWQVKAVKDGQEISAPVAPAPRAQFKTLEKEKFDELTVLRQQKPASHLALGVTYGRFGLLTEAEKEFQQLVKDNPDSAVAKRLLRTVQEWKK